MKLGVAVAVALTGLLCGGCRAPRAEVEKLGAEEAAALGDPAAERRLFDEYRALGRYDRAEAWLTRLREARPADRGLWRAEVGLLLETGRLEACLAEAAALGAVLEIDGATAEWREVELVRGEVLCRLLRWDEAAAVFHGVQERCPEEWRAWVGEAVAWLLRDEDGDVARAEACLDACPAVPEAFVPVQFHRGLVAEREGKTDAAADYYREALAHDPAFVPARRNLALCEEQAGDREAAAREWEAILPLLGPADAELETMIRERLATLRDADDASGDP